MSWDFGMTVDVGAIEPIALSFSKNYTYNVAPMFFDAFPGDKGIRGLDDKLGEECVPILREATCAMEDGAAKYRAMNPANGWGDYEGALGLLRTLLDWCLRAPKARMRIW